MEKLTPNIGEIVRTWLLLLFIASSTCSCAGNPVYNVKDSIIKGVYHRVKSGENLSNIAKAYRIEVRKIIEANHIKDPNRIDVNSVIFIPDAGRVIDDVVTSKEARRPSPSPPFLKASQAGSKESQKSDPSGIKTSVRDSLNDAEITSGISTIQIKPLKRLDRLPSASKGDAKGISADPGSESSVHSKARPSETVHKPALPSEHIGEHPKTTASYDIGIERQRPVSQTPVDAETGPLQLDRKRFIWPIKGKVSSRFGIQPNGMYFNGITISAGEGGGVVAAAGGTVIYSGPLKDYGETVIIKHDDHYATVYTRLGMRKVKIDDRVKQADLIGHLGKADEKGGTAHLNFEIRHQNKARNPILFLP